jgi:hypothetical protein
MPAKPLYTDVPGAPYKIAASVKVACPPNPAQDTTFDYSFLGLVGSVAYLEYSCGCGQEFPTRPMIGVVFPDGRTEEFWPEELSPVHA